MVDCLKKAWKKIKAVRCYVIAAFLFLFMEFLIQSVTGDEPAYMSALKEYGFAETMRFYIFSWSNRTLIDAAAVLVLSLPLYVFKCINAGFFFLQCVTVKRLFQSKEPVSCVVPGLLFLIPYMGFMDAGFSVTSIYYLWPATLGMCAVCLARKPEKKWYEGILAILCTVFACNMEQIVVIVLGAFVYCFVCSRMNGAPSLFLLFEAVLSGCCFLYMLFGSGAASRTAYSIRTEFPEFLMLSPLQKADMGFSVTMKQLLFQGDPLWLLLTLGIFLAVCGAHQENWMRGLGGVPFFSTVLLWLMPGTDTLAGCVTEYGVISLANFDLRNKWLPLAFFFLVAATCLIDLYLIYDLSAEGMLVMSLFVLGLLTRVVMGFSPTVYASGARTYYPLWLCMVFILLRLIKRLDAKWESTVQYAVLLFAVIQNLMFVYSLN